MSSDGTRVVTLSWGGHDGEVLPPDLEPVELTCPRCSAVVIQRFAGPCEPCRRTLRERFRAQGRQVAVAEWEPKMNVTPNAVALKDD